MQAVGTDVNVDALNLDAEERQEAEYHRFLASIIQPVEEAVAALQAATAGERCCEWATTHRDTLLRAAEALRESCPPPWLAVYRNRFLVSIELFLRAADAWMCADAPQGKDCAGRAILALEDAEDIAAALL